MRQVDIEVSVGLVSEAQRVKIRGRRCRKERRRDGCSKEGCAVIYRGRGTIPCGEEGVKVESGKQESWRIERGGRGGKTRGRELRT